MAMTKYYFVIAGLQKAWATNALICISASTTKRRYICWGGLGRVDRCTCADYRHLSHRRRRHSHCFFVFVFFVVAVVVFIVVFVVVVFIGGFVIVVVFDLNEWMTNNLNTRNNQKTRKQILDISCLFHAFLVGHTILCVYERKLHNQRYILCPRDDCNTVFKLN